MQFEYNKTKGLRFIYFFTFFFFIFIDYGKALNIKVLKLHNGLEFYLIKNNNPLITYATWIKAGGIDEKQGKLGVAHFLEHMMFKDNKKYTAQNFTKALQSTGGEYNAFTNYDYTVYYNTIPSHYLGLIMKLESSRLNGLLFNETQFEEERKVILEERGLRIDNNPIVKYIENVNYHVYPGSNYGRSLIGSIADINNITINDLKDFYYHYYVPKNIKIFIIGNVNFKELKRLALKYYNNIPQSKYHIHNPSNLGEVNYKYNFTISIKDKSIIQPIFGISYLAPVLNKKADYETILSLILLKQYLSSETSKLHNVLVKNMFLINNISVSYNPLSRLNTSFQIFFIPRDNTKFTELKSEVDKILNEIAENGISYNELQILYNQFINDITYIKDNNFLLLQLFAELILSGFSVNEINEALVNLDKSLNYKAINNNICLFLKKNKMYININN